MQLHFKEYGQGEPLIVLHGLFGSLENWQAISDGLSDAFHIFALDQRNHGRSPHSAEMNYAV
ncbi:MAG: esterase, partial [Verrucomicrobiota bacterium]